MSGMKRRKFLGLTGLALGPLALGASASAQTLPLTKTPRDLINIAAFILAIRLPYGDEAKKVLT